MPGCWLRAMGGAPKFEESQSLPDSSYADIARLMGFEAVAANRPALLDMRCGPEVPPIPPHATFEQAKSTAEAMLKGDPNAWHVLVQGAKTKLEEILPGRR